MIILSRQPHGFTGRSRIVGQKTEAYIFVACKNSGMFHVPFLWHVSCFFISLVSSPCSLIFRRRSEGGNSQLGALHNIITQIILLNHNHATSNLLLFLGHGDSRDGELFTKCSAGVRFFFCR